MAIQYVGSKIGVASGLGPGDTSVSLTNLTGGLASAPAEGDLIVVAWAVSDELDLTLGIESSGGTAYTLVGSELYSGDTYDANLRVAYRFAGSTPDTAVVVSHNGAPSSGAVHCMVSVWRGVDTTTPLDVAAATATGTNTGRPNPPSITPATAGAVVLVFGAGASVDGADPADFTSSDLSNFRTDGRSGTDYASSCCGFGSYEWTSGAFDPAAFGGGSNTASDSWAAVTLALRPLARVGTASFTLGAITSSAAGTVQVKGTSSPTLAALSLSATAGLLGTGTAALTLGTATLAATGTVQVKAATGGTLADLSLVATGTAVGGNILNVTLAGLTLGGRSPTALFAASEAGFWGEVTPETVWQDTARTIPGAVGQVVKSWQLNTASGVIYATQATTSLAPLLQHDGEDYYLDFDGTDDFLSTSAINFTGTDEMTVIARLRKDSDAAFAVAIELGTSIATTAGSFALTAPGNAALKNYAWRSGGSTRPTGIDSAAHAAPVINVLTGLAKISTDTMTLRVDGVQENTTSGDQGTGNFGNLALYIGRRAGTSSPFNGRVYNLIVRGKLTEGAVLAENEAWAAGSAFGAVTVAGAVTTTLGDTTLAGTGAVQAKGTSGGALADATLGAAGTVLLTGSAALSLTGLTMAATGTVTTRPFDIYAGVSEARYNTLLVEIEALDPSDGTRKTVRATNVNDHRVTGLNDLIWRPAISENARLAIRLFKGDFDGTAAPAGGNLSLQVDQLLPQQANARSFIWVGASIRIWAGRAGDAWPWTQVFEGLVGDNPRAERNRITLPIEVNTEPLEAEILLLKYAGTGGAEGGADLKDKPKPWLLGRCFNVQPVAINLTDSVYQFSAYGPIEAVTKLYERGSDFGASYGDYANYAALVAAAIPAGRWATCLAEGMVRLGAPQAGTITGDVDGDKYAGTWRRKTGEIILRVATNASAFALINETSLTDLDTAVAAVATSNQGRIGVYLTEQETILDFAARLAAPCNAQAGVSLLGELFVSRVGIGASSMTLDAQQRQMPRVTKSVELGTRPPFYRTEMGYARSWRVHSTDEIAFYAELIERGRYDAATFYREGNIVDLADGSRWLYINPVPSAGNAPPTWPTTSNAWWENLSPPITADDQIRILTARVTNARDMSNVSRKLLIATDAGATATISVARHDWYYPNTSGAVTRELGTITALSFSTIYHVYFDDTTLADGTVTYAAASSYDTAQNSDANPGRHYLGAITTPANGGSATDSDGVIGTGNGNGPNIYAGLLYLNGEVAVTVNNINTDNDVNALAPDAPTSVSVSSVLMPDSTAMVTTTWTFTPSSTPSNKNSIDGFLVGLKSQAIGSGGYTYSHADRNSAFRWFVVRPDQLSQVFEVPANREYTAVVIAFRKVMTSVNSLGEILGSVGQSSSSTPHVPRTSPLYQGLIGVSGTSAANIEDWSYYAFQGLDSVGAVKNGKVGTAAIIADALTKADWEAQGGTLALNGSAGYEWTYFSVVHASSTYPFLVQFILDYQMEIVDPDLGNEISATVQIVAKGTSTTYYSDDGAIDPFTLSEVWQGASQTGVFVFSRKTAFFEHVFEGLPADTYEIGYRVACPSSSITMRPYRYLRAEDRKAFK